MLWKTQKNPRDLNQKTEKKTIMNTMIVLFYRQIVAVVPTAAAVVVAS